MNWQSIPQMQSRCAEIPISHSAMVFNRYDEAERSVRLEDCGIRSSPSWELRTASPRGHYGERLQRDSCLKKHM